METCLQSNGWISLPKNLRLRHGWSEGQRFRVVEDGDSVKLVPEAAASVERVLGMLKSDVVFGIEAMEEAIAGELSDRHARP
ncbi:MAG: hypothetical protein RL318_1072 [Fibrobacterota bacterium]|jgi:bifunctional DNA-binding transcriptional regulator/antitoxin component of YhaV-PrlF toxin-antitoxin module